MMEKAHEKGYTSLAESLRYPLHESRVAKTII